MTKEELKEYFTEVVHVGYEEYPVWELLKMYYTVESVSRYYLPVVHSECRWIVTIACSDCCGRYTHDRLHDEDFHLAANQALQGDWILKPGAGFWKIVSDEWVRNATELDVRELDMTEISREKLEEAFNSNHPYPRIDISKRPLMHLVQRLKSMTPVGSYGTFYNLGNGIKVYSCDTPETLMERIVGREQTIQEMLEEIGMKSLAEKIDERENEKKDDKGETEELVQEEA